MNYRSMIAALAAGIALGGCSQGSVLGSSDSGHGARSASASHKWHVTSLLQIAKPSGIAVQTTTKIYFDEFYARNANLLKKNGNIVNLGGDLTEPRGIALYRSTLYIADAGSQSVKSISSKGVVHTIGTGWLDPLDVATTKTGDLFVMDAGARTVTRVTPQGDSKVVVPATLCSNLSGLAVDAAEDVYVSCFITSAVYRVKPNGNTSTICSGWNQPYALGVDSSGNVYAANDSAKSLAECTPAGDLQSIKTDAKVSGISGIDPLNGTLYVSSSGQGRIYQITRP